MSASALYKVAIGFYLLAMTGFGFVLALHGRLKTIALVVQWLVLMVGFLVTRMANRAAKRGRA